jgi:hypothetical protein
MKKRGMNLILSFALFAVLEELLGILIPDKVLNVAFAVITTVALIALLLVAYGTYSRNQWGVNFQQVNCPFCHAPVPRVRKPRSRRQLFWGGGTCEKCGCEMDKWGKPLTR